MNRKIRLANKRRFVLASMTTVSFAIFVYFLAAFLMTEKSAWSEIENNEGPLSNQKIIIEANPQSGAFLYSGDTIRFTAIHQYTVKESGEQKSKSLDKKIQIICSDPIVGTPLDNEFLVTQEVSEAKNFTITCRYEDKTVEFNYRLFAKK